MRTGKEYLESLKDNRQVYADGERVEDISTHPAFKGITQSIANIYDIAADEKNDMIYTTEDGKEANKIWLIPKNMDDLKTRREAMTTWAESTFGFAGRTPDHVAGFLAGFAARPDIFEREGGFKDNVINFYKYARDNDLFISYIIIPPQSSKAMKSKANKSNSVRVKKKTEDGIILEGSQMLGTGTAVSDYIHVSYIGPLPPGDEDKAISLVVPTGAPGLKVYTRPSFAINKPSVYDYPLSTRFDESDGLVVFDDVFIPWEHVFVFGNRELLQQHFHESPAHMYGNNQAQVRFVTKLKFYIGLAQKIVKMNGSDKIPAVQEKLGELASTAASMEAFMLASEYKCTVDHGIAYPDRRSLYGLVGLQDVTFSKVLHIIRDLVGAGVLQVPSTYKEILAEKTKGDMVEYMGASDIESEDRIKLFKLAWDAIGTEFAGRTEQYEMFYNGAPFVTKGYAFRNYGFEEAVSLVDKCMNEYSIPES